AELRPHVGLLEGDLGPVPAGDGLLVGADRLGGDRTDLLADHARRLHRPREAPPAIEERGPDRDGSLRGVLPHPQLPGEAGLPDRPGGAQLAAEAAVELAEADGEVHHRRPQSLEPALGEGGGLEHVGRTHPDALVALDAALEALALLDGPGWADGL